MADVRRIGVIGGSGLYDMEGLSSKREETIETPFGDPSGPITIGTLDGADGVELAFVPRHGPGHLLLPSEVPYAANIWALRSLGVERVISYSAVGSLREEIEPGHLVFPDQFWDRTKGVRRDTFFGDGVVAHVSFADPFCADLRATVADCAEAVGATVHRGGTYVCMEGPAFSTRAESEFHRSIGASVIGMTNLTEAKLAREAELCYVTVALSTDYDCWHEEDVTTEAVLEVLRRNVATAQELVRRAAPAAAGLPRPRTCACSHALRNAVLSDRERAPEETLRRLDLLLGGDAS